jgi:hypothetical protein
VGEREKSLSDAERPSDNLEIDEIMAKLEQVRKERIDRQTEEEEEREKECMRDKDRERERERE